MQFLIRRNHLSFTHTGCVISHTVTLPDLPAGRRVANYYPDVETPALVCHTDPSVACVAVTRTTRIAGVAVASDMGGHESGDLAECAFKHDFCRSTCAFPCIATFRMDAWNHVAAICGETDHRIPDDDVCDENKYNRTTTPSETAMEAAFGLANGDSILAVNFSYGIVCRQGAGEGALVALACSG